MEIPYKDKLSLSLLITVELLLFLLAMNRMSDNFTTQFEGFFELSITVGLFLLSFAVYIEANKKQEFMRLSVRSHVAYLMFGFIPAIGLMISVACFKGGNPSLALSATIFTIGIFFLINLIPLCTVPADECVPCYADKDICYNTHASHEDMYIY